MQSLEARGTAKVEGEDTRRARIAGGVADGVELAGVKVAYYDGPQRTPCRSFTGRTRHAFTILRPCQVRGGLGVSPSRFLPPFAWKNVSLGRGSLRRLDS